MARTKKSAPMFPTADQIEKLRTRLQMLISVGDPQKVDKQLEQLLLSLGLDPTSPTAWRDGFCLLACLHYDIGKLPRTNKNAEKLSSADDLLLLREIFQLRGRGLTVEQAIKELVSDRSKERLFKFKPLSSKAQRVETLRKRLDKIKKVSRGDTWLRNVFGKPPESIVEDALMNLYLAEPVKLARR
jgi:DNA-binding transcriptional MerR regulator